MATSQNTAPLYLSVEMVAHRYGVSTDTIYRWTRIGDFPRPYKFSAGSARWSVAELLEHESTLKVGFMIFVEGEMFEHRFAA